MKKDNQTENKTTEKKRVFRTIRIIKNVFFGIIIALLAIVLLVTLYARISNNTPSLFGYSVLRVSSGSMEPELQVKDIILVQKCDGNSVKKGEIITFIGATGELRDKLVTHRVVKEPYEENGEKYIVTKGDANDLEDPPLKVGRVQGRLITKIPLLKQLFDFFVTPWGLLALIGLIILGFFNEIVIFVKSLSGANDEQDRKNINEIIERYQKEALKKDLESKKNSPDEITDLQNNSQQESKDE